MGLKAFTFDTGLTDAFVALGYDLYRDDPSFVPPLEAALRAQLEPWFPFYGRVGHQHCRFLALAGGRPVARALASVHPGLHDRDGTPVGAVGFFESVDDYAAAGDVLQTAVEWLQARGLRRIWGPLNFDVWHGYRFMTRGFEQDRFLGEPYNKPYYADLFARSGFGVRQRWNSFELNAADLDGLAAPGASDYRRLLVQGYRFEPFDVRRFEASLQTLHQGLSDSFAGFLGFTPISYAEFREVAGVARHAVEPRCSTFIYDERGVLAGFTTVFRDLAGALTAMQGRDSLLAQARFFWERRRARRLMVHLGGATRAEAARHSGLARAGVHHTLRCIREAGQQVLVTLVAAGNPVRKLYGSCAADERREYVLCELQR